MDLHVLVVSTGDRFDYANAWIVSIIVALDVLGTADALDDVIAARHGNRLHLAVTNLSSRLTWDGMYPRRHQVDSATSGCRQRSC